MKVIELTLTDRRNEAVEIYEIKAADDAEGRTLQDLLYAVRREGLSGRDIWGEWFNFRVNDDIVLTARYVERDVD